MHADDMQEVVAQGSDEAADERSIEQQRGRLSGVWNQHVEAEHAQLENGVVVGSAHVGQRQHHQQLRENLPQVASMHCLHNDREECISLHEFLSTFLSKPGHLLAGTTLENL